MPSPPRSSATERYRLISPLGEGGMGRVWLARDEVLHRDVAVKEVVPPSGLTESEGEEASERGLREARAIARLNHPNVVRIYDVVARPRRPWIVMEYVRSRSLQERIAEDGPLPVPEVARIGLDILSALHAAHRAGVLHRDVKPSNVLIADDGRVVLTDFGLATLAGDATLTRSGLILGSPAYIAPERARQGTTGTESDLWSLGATLFAAVEGRAPYHRSTAMATLTALVTEPPDPTMLAGPLVPVLDGLLDKNPATRMTAPQAAHALRRLLGSLRRVGEQPRRLPRERRPSGRPALGSLPSAPPHRPAMPAQPVPQQPQRPAVGRAQAPARPTWPAVGRAQPPLRPAEPPVQRPAVGRAQPPAPPRDQPPTWPPIPVSPQADGDTGARPSDARPAAGPPVSTGQAASTAPTGSAEPGAPMGSAEPGASTASPEPGDHVEPGPATSPAAEERAAAEELAAEQRAAAEEPAAEHSAAEEPAAEEPAAEEPAAEQRVAIESAVVEPTAESSEASAAAEPEAAELSVASSAGGASAAAEPGTVGASSVEGASPAAGSVAEPSGASAVSPDDGGEPSAVAGSAAAESEPDQRFAAESRRSAIESTSDSMGLWPMAEPWQGEPEPVASPTAGTEPAADASTDAGSLGDEPAGNQSSTSGPADLGPVAGEDAAPEISAPGDAPSEDAASGDAPSEDAAPADASGGAASGGAASGGAASGDAAFENAATEHTAIEHSASEHSASEHGGFGDTPAESTLAESAAAESAAGERTEPANSAAIEHTAVDPVADRLDATVVEPVAGGLDATVVDPVAGGLDATAVEPVAGGLDATVVDPVAGGLDATAVDPVAGQPDATAVEPIPAGVAATGLTAAGSAAAGPIAAGPRGAGLVPPRILRGGPVTGRRPYVRVSPPAAESTRTLMFAALCVLVAAVIVAVLVGVGLRPSHPSGTAMPSPGTHPAQAPSATPASPSPAGTPSPSATVSSRSASPTVPASSAGTGLPAGWHLYRDPTGFSVAVPDGWTLSHSGSIVYFHDPAGGRLLGVDQTDQPKSDPVADWTSQSQYRVSHGDFPGYHQIKIAAVPYHLKAADWEFTYDKNGVRTHVINRGAVFGPHQAYGFYWSTPDSVWAANLPNFELIMSTFQGRT